MLTDNICESDRLVNSSISTVNHLDMRWRPLCNTIYVNFEDGKASNSLEDIRLRGELKGYVQITTRANRFPSKKGKNTVIAKRKQFPLILGHWITVHDASQYSGIYAGWLKLIYWQGQVRIMNKLYLRVNFTPYIPVQKVGIRFNCWILILTLFRTGCRGAKRLPY